jgi:hypothetical protein
MIRRASIVGAIVVVLALAFPPMSGAARLGPRLPMQSESRVQCAYPCTLAQVRLRGQPMKAPVSGTISRFRVERPDGTYRLQVLHKRDNGSYRAIRESRAFTDTSGHGLKAFPVGLPIHKGDFIGLRMPGNSYVWNVPRPGALWETFARPIAVGTSSQPLSSNPDELLLYNAAIRQ